MPLPNGGRRVRVLLPDASTLDNALKVACLCGDGPQLSPPQLTAALTQLDASVEARASAAAAAATRGLAADLQQHVAQARTDAQAQQAVMLLYGSAVLGIAIAALMSCRLAAAPTTVAAAPRGNVGAKGGAGGVADVTPNGGARRAGPSRWFVRAVMALAVLNGGLAVLLNAGPLAGMLQGGANAHDDSGTALAWLRWHGWHHLDMSSVQAHGRAALVSVIGSVRNLARL